jgi:long-chain acyl-CoA synthetase
MALRFYGQDMSYGELNEAIDRFANALMDLGLKKGDRVGLFMQTCPQFVIGYMGALRAGGVAVAFNPMFKHSELAYEIRDTGLEILVGSDYPYSEVQRIEGNLPLKKIILTFLGEYLPEKPVLPLPAEAESPKEEFSRHPEFCGSA